MTSKLLQDAREYEKKGINSADKKDRPLFHATGAIGWINDPNGFSRYKDTYHLFYQYHPYSNHWGPMHWGHSVTKDFVKWEFLPCAMAPDEEYDKDGCFSGSAIELEDGRQLLMYTSVIRKEDSDGEIRDYQQQCIAIGDGVDFEKHQANPVISTEMIPEENDIHDFRDPKIIKNGDKYYCFAINRHPDGSGQILVYESMDAVKWSFAKVLDRSNNQVGRIWECPDYFDLDGKRVLIVSPQEVTGDGANVFPGFNNFFLVGHGKEFLDFNRESVQPIDLGTDFYAAQTLQAEDGRRIMIGWMQNWETCNYANDLHDYYGMMTIPRELKIDCGYVLQQPVKELENYYLKDFSHKNALVNKKTSLSNINGRVFDMTISISPEQEKDYEFTVALAKNADYETRITYNRRNNQIRLDRTKSGIMFSSLSLREFYVDDNQGEIKLRIVMDKYSMELFVNDGRQAASMKIDTPLVASEITFSSSQPVKMDVEYHSFDESKFKN